MTRTPTTTPQAEPHLLSLERVADHCKLSETAVLDLVAQRKFPKPALSNGATFTRWLNTTIDEWLANPDAWARGNPPQRWLTAHDLVNRRDTDGRRHAGLAGLSAATLWRRISRGEYPAPRREGGRSLWDSDEVHAWSSARAAAAKGVAP